MLTTEYVLRQLNLPISDSNTSVAESLIEKIKREHNDCLQLIIMKNIYGWLEENSKDPFFIEIGRQNRLSIEDRIKNILGL